MLGDIIGARLGQQKPQRKSATSEAIVGRPRGAALEMQGFGGRSLLMWSRSGWRSPRGCGCLGRSSAQEKRLEKTEGSSRGVNGVCVCVCVCVWISPLVPNAHCSMRLVFSCIRSAQTCLTDQTRVLVGDSALCLE